MVSAFAKRIRTAKAKYGESKRAITPFRTKLRTSNVISTSTRRTFPNYIDQKMVYCTTISMNPGAGTAANYVFSANGIFDPDFSGIGHQPMGYDEMSLIYSKYRVVRSKIEATFVAAGNTASSHCIVGTRVSSQANTSTDIEKLTEFPENVTRCISGSPNQQYLSVSWRSTTNAQLTQEDGMNAIYGANPSTDEYFHVYGGYWDSITDPDPIKVFVRITYWVRSYDPKDLSKS